VSGSSTPIDTGPNPVINILVFSNIDGTEPLVVKRKWNQDFRLILDAWLGRQQALPEHVKKNIYFTWRCKKIFPVATCRSLGIKLDQYGNAMIPNDQGDMRISDDQIVLVATTDAQLKKEKDAEEAERKRKEKVEEEPEAAPEEATVKKLRLYLRCPDYKEVRLAVLPETIVERLEAAFRNNNNIPQDKSVTLIFDGEELERNMTMQELDVEDLNMFEVRVR